jgi:hypothetical protein
MVWILLAFMIWWDHPNLLTLSSSAYKRREALMEKGFMVMVLWLGIISLVGVALRFALSR